jgi:dienelactone hydrolase family protein
MVVSGSTFRIKQLIAQVGDPNSWPNRIHVLFSHHIFSMSKEEPMPHTSPDVSKYSAPTHQLLVFALFLAIFLSLDISSSVASERFKVNWLAVSDRQELDRTWQRALVYLPERLGSVSGRLVQDGRLEKAVSQVETRKKWPLILFMHYCEGLGHHREDIKRLSKLGFIVIAPDSFARNHRPLGCYEDREKFIRYFDAAVAFQKAELDYAVQKLSAFDWIDRSNLFLFGSGMGGLVVAHYESDSFAGHLIEGWGCRGPNPIFDGIWAPPQVRVFSTVSKNTPFLLKNEGFSVDCETFIRDRADSVSVVLERPAHQVSWYPKSYKPMIRFLMRDMGTDVDRLLEDLPEVLTRSPDGIQLREKWSDWAVRDLVRRHCETFDKQVRLTGEPFDGDYQFVCE